MIAAASLCTGGWTFIVRGRGKTKKEMAHRKKGHMPRCFASFLDGDRHARKEIAHQIQAQIGEHFLTIYRGISPVSLARQTRQLPHVRSNGHAVDREPAKLIDGLRTYASHNSRERRAEKIVPNVSSRSLVGITDHEVAIGRFREVAKEARQEIARRDLLERS